MKLVGIFKDYAKTFTIPAFTNSFWWLLSRIRLRLVVSKMCILKASNFCKNCIKQITGARKCNLDWYFICGNKILVWITRQQYSRSQDLPSTLVLMDSVFSELKSIKLSCYFLFQVIITFRGCQDSSGNLLFFT